jgi:hypothetical protein
VVAIVLRTFAFSASDHSSGETVSIGPEGYMRSGTRIMPLKCRSCGEAPEKARWGLRSRLLNRSIASCALSVCVLC